MKNKLRKRVSAGLIISVLAVMAALLEAGAADLGFEVPLYVGCARAGSPDPVVAAGTADRLRKVDFGEPLHVVIVPGELHVMEREYLEAFAGL